MPKPFTSTAQISAALTRFKNAARDDEMRGAAHPEDRDGIHERYKRARKNLVERMIATFIGGEND